MKKNQFEIIFAHKKCKLQFLLFYHDFYSMNIHILTDVGLEPSVTSVRGSCGERDRGGGRGLSSHTGPSGGLVSISPGTASGAIGGLSPASGSNLVLGSSGTNQRRFDEDVNLPLIKVVVLGAPTVGKTSVVRVSAFTSRRSAIFITDLSRCITLLSSLHSAVHIFTHLLKHATFKTIKDFF